MALLGVIFLMDAQPFVVLIVVMVIIAEMTIMAAMIKLLRITKLN